MPHPNLNQPDFLPTTREAMNAQGWDELDVLLVSGDAYVDHHSFGTSLLGRWLIANGFRTGLICQPRWDNPDDITRLGRPRLFAGVSAGALDSLVAHYTAFRKKRGEDAYSPGGATGQRPNRAVIVYTGLVRAAYPGLPVVAGGIEASLRRATHYDFWSDALRRSIVLDSKADMVLYGMAEKSILAVAKLLAELPPRQKAAEALTAARLPGSAYAVHPDAVPAGAEELPSHEAILADPEFLIKATLAFERQMLQGGPCLVQRSGGRAVVFEPPPEPLSTAEMDAVYSLPFTRLAHPAYHEAIPAVAMIAESVTSHRGCAGGCSFCSLTLHQGRAIQSRSEKSILAEVARLAEGPEWKGSVSDIGGPTANMWQAECTGEREKCQRASCLFPKRCRFFQAPQEAVAALLRKAAVLPGVQHVRVASGVRHDLALESDAYMAALVGEFTGGQLKIAPEHISEKVLRLMRKPPLRLWETFLRKFDKLSAEAGKEQFVIPYLLSAFPGCGDAEMEELAAWLKRRGWKPQQVQCFIPTPGTLATAMFYAKKDADGRPIFVARTDAERMHQHYLIAPEEKPAPPKREFRPRTGDSRPGGRDFRHQPRGNERRDFRNEPRREGGSETRDKPRTAFRNDSKPYDRKPTGDRPFDRKPTGDRPYDRKPAGNRPFDRKPTGDRSYDRKPAGDRTFDRKPTGDRPYDRKPAGDRPFDRKPAGNRPFDRKPTGDRPFDRKSAGDRPYDRKSAGDRAYDRKPAGDRPYDRKPAGNRPFDRKPPGNRPFDRKPIGDRPYDRKPAGDRPYDRKPAGDRSYDRKPAGDRPYDRKPTGDRPFDRKPTGDRPYDRKPAGDRPFNRKPPGGGSYGGKPPGDKPFGRKPPGGKPRFGKPPTGKPRGGGKP